MIGNGTVHSNENIPGQKHHHMNSNGRLSYNLQDDTDPLCCCEYINQNDDRSHLLACCCDCDAIDELADRCVTCRSVPPQLYDKIGQMVNDRLRLPWCYGGGGALRLRSDILLPLVLVPLALFVSTLHPVATVLVMLATPTLVLFLYRFWLGAKHRAQSRLLFNWTLTSVVVAYVVLMFPVNILHKLLLWENMAFNTLFLALLYALIRIHQHPGVVMRPRVGTLAGGSGRRGVHRKSLSLGGQEDFYARPGSANNTPSAYGSNRGGVEYFQTNTNYDLPEPVLGMPGPRSPNSVSQASSECSSGLGSSPLPSSVSDASSTTSNASSSSGTGSTAQVTPPSPAHQEHHTRSLGMPTWCGICQVEQPPRSSHCPICNVCVMARDHHCVWIGCCIGASNQRLFFFTCLLFLATTLYGSLLAINTVCTPNMYADWFLFPVDCRFVYQDSMTSWIFVTCVYCLIFSVPVLFLWLKQAVLVSQNVTTQELWRAKQEKRTRLWLWIPRHPYNRGFLRNWVDFLLGRRHLVTPIQYAVSATSQPCPVHPHHTQVPSRRPKVTDYTAVTQVDPDTIEVVHSYDTPSSLAVSGGKNLSSSLNSSVKHVFMNGGPKSSPTTSYGNGHVGSSKHARQNVNVATSNGFVPSHRPTNGVTSSDSFDNNASSSSLLIS